MSSCKEEFHSTNDPSFLLCDDQPLPIAIKRRQSLGGKRKCSLHPLPLYRLNPVYVTCRSYIIVEYIVIVCYALVITWPIRDTGDTMKQL